MKKIIANDAMKKGLIIGILFSMNFLISTTSYEFMQYVMMIVILYLVYLYTKRCRDTILGGVISFGRAWKYVFQLFLYGSLISAFVKFIYLKFVNPDYLFEIQNKVMLFYDSQQLPADVMNKMSEMLDTLLTPVSFSVNSIWLNLFYAAFLGIFIALFVKKEKSIFD